ncbi:MAG: hypothetical protein WBA41_00860 [Rivularia sp. (in: cyanobacteria)]
MITNPGYTSVGEGSIPYPLTIPIPKIDIVRIDRSEQLWLEQIYPRLIMRSPIGDVNQLDEAIDLRERIAEQLLMAGEHSVQSINQVEGKEIELVSPDRDETW